MVGKNESKYSFSDSSDSSDNEKGGISLNE